MSAIYRVFSFNILLWFIGFININTDFLDSFEWGIEVNAISQEIQWSTRKKSLLKHVEPLNEHVTASFKLLICTTHIYCYIKCSVGDFQGKLCTIYTMVWWLALLSSRNVELTLLGFEPATFTLLSQLWAWDSNWATESTSIEYAVGGLYVLFHLQFNKNRISSFVSLLYCTFKTLKICFSSQ